ncbi:MAG: hypothetical protein ABH845_06455, partial [Candidatus Omnitrophota bacterium]
PNAASCYAAFSGKRWVGYNQYHLLYYSPKTIFAPLCQAKFEKIQVRTTHANLFSKEGLWRLGLYQTLAAFRDRVRQQKATQKEAISETKTPWRIGPIGKLVNALPNAFLNLLRLGDQLLVIARKGSLDEIGSA